MPGKPITQEQVNLYMSYQKNSKQSQASAAAKAGFSERTARRIDNGEHKTAHIPRQYCTRKDPFNGLFEQHVVPLLEENPEFKGYPLNMNSAHLQLVGCLPIPLSSFFNYLTHFSIVDLPTPIAAASLTI